MVRGYGLQVHVYKKSLSKSRHILLQFKSVDPNGSQPTHQLPILIVPSLIFFAGAGVFDLSEGPFHVVPRLVATPGGRDPLVSYRIQNEALSQSREDAERMLYS